MRVLLLLLTAFSGECLSQEVELPAVKDLPRTVHREIDMYQRTVSKARQQYTNAVVKAGKKLEDDIEDALRRSMRDNDAKSVVSLKSFLEKVKKSNENALLGTGWKPIFRGVSGAKYNSDVATLQDGTFAVRLTENISISFLRLTNLNTRQSVIVKCNLKLTDLAKQVDLGDGWIWNGSAKRFTGSEGHDDCWQLGLANKKWEHGYKQKATIAGPRYGYGGYGFGRQNHVNNHGGTQYMWADNVLPQPFLLEISVSAKLSVDESDGMLLN